MSLLFGGTLLPDSVPSLSFHSMNDPHHNSQQRLDHNNEHTTSMQLLSWHTLYYSISQANNNSQANNELVVVV